MTLDFTKDYFWSIDPGESKCGVAIFDGGMSQTAYQSTPSETLDELWRHLTGQEDEYAMPRRRPAAIVLERFALRPDLAPQQSGSEMGTSQMIGAIRWMCLHHGVPLHMQTPWQATSLERSEPFKSWPQRKFTSYGQGRDAKMAELHGLFRMSTSLSAAARAEWHRTLAEQY